MSDDLKVPRTDPLLPPGMTDRDVECPGDDEDGCCKDCGAPLNEDGNCISGACNAYEDREEWARRGVGWGCSDRCGWCGRC